MIAAGLGERGGAAGLVVLGVRAADPVLEVAEQLTEAPRPRAEIMYVLEYSPAESSAW